MSSHSIVQQLFDSLPEQRTGRKSHAENEALIIFLAIAALQMPEGGDMPPEGVPPEGGEFNFPPEMAQSGMGMNMTWNCTESQETDLLNACPDLNATILFNIKNNRGTDPMDLFTDKPSTISSICSQPACLTTISSMTCLPPDLAMVTSVCQCHTQVSSSGCDVVSFASATAMIGQPDKMTPEAIASVSTAMQPFCSADASCKATLEAAGETCMVVSAEMVSSLCCLYDIMADEKCFALMTSMPPGGAVPGMNMSTGNPDDPMANYDSMETVTMADYAMMQSKFFCDYQECLPKMSCLGGSDSDMMGGGSGGMVSPSMGGETEMAMSGGEMNMDNMDMSMDMPTGGAMYDSDYNMGGMN
eukprot:scaffold82265_cov42-Prasinocladus_malaysianus.AAC.1